MTTQAVQESNTALLERVAESYLRRKQDRRPVTRNQIASMVKIILERAESRRSDGRKTVSMSACLRGLAAMRGQTITSETLESDLAVVRALQTGTTPGSYVVPTIQSDNIIAQLSQEAVARVAGARVWDMAGIQTLNIPGELASPSFVWQAQNSRQTPTDPNLGQMVFDLKTLQALILLPRELFRVSVPAFDIILEKGFALGAGEAEDNALWATSTASGGPTALMSAANITTVMVGASPNGGNLAFSDILAVLLKSAQLKVRGPKAWYCSPRTLFSRLLALSDTSSRPLLVPDITQGGSGYSLMGHPLFCTVSILENETNGSGSSQSHLVLTRPDSIHVAQNNVIEMSVSTDFAFDAAQIGLRVNHGLSFGYSPAASVCVLAGIN